MGVGTGSWWEINPVGVNGWDPFFRGFDFRRGVALVDGLWDGVSADEFWAEASVNELWEGGSVDGSRDKASVVEF